MHDWFVAHYEVLKDFAGPTVTLLGFVITTILAIAGLKTFDRWKREKLEERRIEIAIDALSVAYEAQLVFERIRRRIVREYEYEGMPANGGRGITDSRRRSQGSAYAVLKRIEAEQEFFDRVLRLEPKFVAIFGAESESIFMLLHVARREVETTAEALIDEYRIELDREDQEGRELRRNWRTNVFASPGKVEENDEVGKKLREFRRQIEICCRGIVERGFRS
jgi:hypothetical protein